jgi:hypothetical protein
LNQGRDIHTDTIVTREICSFGTQKYVFPGEGTELQKVQNVICFSKAQYKYFELTANKEECVP